MNRFLLAGALCLLVLSTGCTDDPVSMRTYGDSTRAVWSYPLSGGYMNAVQPAMERGRAFVAADSLLRCVDWQAQDACWTRPLSAWRSLGARRVAMDSARVYVNHFDTVWAVDRVTGRVTWRTVVDGFEGVDLQGLAANDTHFLLGGVGEVVRIRRADGGVDLRLDVPPADSTAPEPFVFDPALFSDGTMVVPTFFRRSGGAYFEGSLRVYAPDGTLRWTRSTTHRQYDLPGGRQYTAGGGVHGVDVASGDPSLIVYTIGQSVVARDLATGETVWHAFQRKHGFGVRPTVADSLVLAGSTTGRLFALDLATGEERWHVDVQGGMLAPATVHDGVVYQIDDGYGVLWAIDRTTGEPLWHAYPPEHATDPDATFRTAPALEGDRLVIVGSKRVYGLKVDGQP